VLVGKIDRVGRIRTLHGDMGVWHKYTFGLAGERFFRTLAEKRVLLATRCETCRKTYLPPKIYCPTCFAELTVWVELPPRGYVETYTFLYEDLEENRLTEPVAVAFVTFPGVEGGIIHRLGEVRPEEVCSGLEVEAVLAAERSGGLQDILYFRPSRE
jgi:uncharacterized OB-fold protein